MQSAISSAHFGSISNIESISWMTGRRENYSRHDTEYGQRPSTQYDPYPS